MSFTSGVRIPGFDVGIVAVVSGTKTSGMFTTGGLDTVGGGNGVVTTADGVDTVGGISSTWLTPGGALTNVVLPTPDGTTVRGVT